MRAVTFTDGRIEIADRPDPVPGTGELLVRVRAAGVNNADLVQRAGHYPAPIGSPPDIPGLELAGEVIAIGSGVVRYAVGDRVMALVGGGGQAELAVVHERVALPVPPDMAWTEAGGFAEVFTTAHDAVFTQCALAMGERVLITGAAGGVGVAAVQLAAVAGARVVASVRDGARHEEVAGLAGAGTTVRVISPEQAAEHGPYDVVLEMFPKANLAEDVKRLTTGGRISIIAVAGGSTVSFDAFALMACRGRIHASSLRARSLEDKADAARRMERHVVPLLVVGRLRVPIQATYRLDAAEAAYAAFAAGGKFGKIVIET